MATLKEVFTYEATQLEPLFYVYYNLPSKAAAKAYVVPALSWAADASAALQARGANLDPLYRVVGERYNVVVKHLNKIHDDGNDPAPFELPGFFDLAYQRIEGTGETTANVLKWVPWALGGILIAWGLSSLAKLKG